MAHDEVAPLCDCAVLGHVGVNPQIRISKKPEIRHLLPDTRDDQSSSRPLHKVHLHLTKPSAMPILKSSQRDDEIRWGGTFRTTLEYSRCYLFWFCHRFLQSAFAAATVCERGARTSDRFGTVSTRRTHRLPWEPTKVSIRRDQPIRCRCRCSLMAAEWPQQLCPVRLTCVWA